MVYHAVCLLCRHSLLHRQRKARLLLSDTRRDQDSLRRADGGREGGNVKGEREGEHMPVYTKQTKRRNVFSRQMLRTRWGAQTDSDARAKILFLIKPASSRGASPRALLLSARREGGDKTQAHLDTYAHYPTNCARSLLPCLSLPLPSLSLSLPSLPSLSLSLSHHLPLLPFGIPLPFPRPLARRSPARTTPPLPAPALSSRPPTPLGGPSAQRPQFRELKLTRHPRPRGRGG
jgi:hypothetical protein